MEPQKKVIETANSQVGYREGANNYNKYAAELDPLDVTYGRKQNCAWCGEFVLWVFYKCFGILDALRMLCSPVPTAIPLCSSAAQYFKNAGRWTTQPSLGAVVFFFSGGAINHTGIVTAVNGKTITTVEGNSSDMVSRRTYTIGTPYIAGYGLPRWDIADESGEIIVAPVVKTTAELPELQCGDTGETVRAAQFLLIGRGFTCGSYGADGDYGNATRAACLNFQRVHDLEADGVIGAQTWAALLGVR